MPAVKTLILGWVVLGALCLPAEGAGTQWWAWNRSWWMGFDGTPVGPYGVMAAPVAAEATRGVANSPVVLYAIQREWMPAVPLPLSIRLYTIPGPAVSPSYPTNWGITDTSLGSYAGGWEAPSYQYDAFINLGDGPYASEAMLTTGGAQPWYDSPVVEKVYGGEPTAEQRAAFTNTVLDRVEQAFVRSGVTDISLTANPMDAAARSLSVVSGTEYGPNSSAIGITNMNGDGFSFIDKLPYAKSVDELQWAVAHNVAHELMHAFGVEHHDSTGSYLDSAVAPWEVLVDPNTVFGPEATRELLASNFQDRYNTSPYGLSAQHVHGAQCLCAAAMNISPSPVPEPGSLALWGAAGVFALLVRLHRVRSTRAA